MATIGQMIKKLRKERNLTQEQLAEQINVTFQAISKWENETGMPDISQIVPLANAFSVSTDTLFGLKNTATGKVILICGKIGAGKTTYAKKLTAQLNGVFMEQFELLYLIFGADMRRLLNTERDRFFQYCYRASEYVHRKVGEAAKSGATVIYDAGGCWSRLEREELRTLYTNMGISYELHYINTPENQRLENIQKRNNAIERGELDIPFTHKDDINHFFETPDDDEIDFII
jgi:Predicted transcriptional regulators